MSALLKENNNLYQVNSVFVNECHIYVKPYLWGDKTNDDTTPFIRWTYLHYIVVNIKSYKTHTFAIVMKYSCIIE